MTNLFFTKMQASGNDYIILEKENILKKDYKNLSISLCNRHYGGGALGIIILSFSSNGTPIFEVYNSFGNKVYLSSAFRCGIYYVYYHKLIHQKHFSFMAGEELTNAFVQTDEEDQILSIALEVKVPFFDKKSESSKKILVNHKEWDIHLVCIEKSYLIIFSQKFLPQEEEKLEKEIYNFPQYSKDFSLIFVQIENAHSLFIKSPEKITEPIIYDDSAYFSVGFITSLREGMRESSFEIKSLNEKIHFQMISEEKIKLEGSVKIIFEGKYNCL